LLIFLFVSLFFSTNWESAEYLLDSQQIQEFFPIRSFKTDCGAHPASYPERTGSPFIGGKSAGE